MMCNVAQAYTIHMRYHLPVTHVLLSLVFSCCDISFKPKEDLGLDL